VFAA
jgi:hypothetical protein